MTVMAKELGEKTNSTFTGQEGHVTQPGFRYICAGGGSI
jgi:hypothetical protein